MSLYFKLLLLSVVIPLLLSFDKRLQFYKKWKYILPSIFIVAFVYILFDILLTSNGVWGFNQKYLSGITVYNLPLEECLFFLAIPYASLFLHYSVKEYFPNLKLNDLTTRTLALVMGILSLVILLFNLNNQYTLYIFTKLIVVLFFAYFDKRQTLNVFFITFLIILVPFFLVNGILTGSFIDGEIVWYNNDENFGIRIFTIPVEDFAYAFSMILFGLLLTENIEKLSAKK